jgi:hypothetical protein
MLPVPPPRLQEIGDRADCRRSGCYLYLESSTSRTIDMNSSDETSDLLALTTEIVDRQRPEHTG